MQKLVWQNSNGDVIDLTSGNYGITEWEGFSNTSLNIQSQQVPFQDGGVYLDALMEQRELSVTLKMQDNGNLENRYRMRRELIHSLNPKLGEGYLIYTNDFISKRIKCVAQIPLFETHNSDMAGTPKASLSWTACEPYWEDLEETSVYFKFGQIAKINNEGDVKSQMEIDFFTSNVENPSIIKITDNTRIQYNGLLTKGLHINTNIGKKSIATEELKYDISQYAGDISDVCYSKKLSLFVAVAQNVIYTSYEGLEWIINSCGYNINLNAITYSEELNLFVAVCNENSVITSSDGINWNHINILNSYQLKNITYSEGLNLFVAVGTYRAIVTSSDGINWNVVTLPATRDFSLYSITYSEDLNLFVAVGYYHSNYYGVVITSSDGINWTLRENPVLGYINDVTYSEDLNLFVAVGYDANGGVVITSSDGINWTLQENPESNALKAVIYSKELGLFIALGNHVVITSSDGINWEVRSEQSFNAITYSEELNLFVAVGQLTKIDTSSDCINWNSVMINRNGSDMFAITYSEDLNLFIAIYSKKILTSSDGINWQEIYQQEIIAYTNSSVIYSTKIKKIIIGGTNKVLLSNDGINFTQYNVEDFNFYSITYSEDLNLFVAVGAYSNYGKILTSIDGVNWVVRYSHSTQNAFNSITYSEDLNLFVAVGTLIMATSSDGVNWNVTQNDFYICRAVTYSEDLNLFVAVGYVKGSSRGFILTSSDGVNWNSVEFTQSIIGVVYAKELGLFVAVGSGGHIYTSADCVNWDIVESGVSSLLSVVVFSSIRNKLVIGGQDGVILYSYFSNNENQIQNITSDSDMNLNLSVGLNKFRLTKEQGNLGCRITYRQKYIGV